MIIFDFNADLALNVVCVVFNDGHYGNVRRDLSLDWSGDYGTSFVNPDFVKMAESYGALGLKVTDPEKVGEAVSKGIDSKRPTIIDVEMMDTNEVPRPFSVRAPWTLPQDDLLD